MCYLHIKQIAISQERRAIWKSYRWGPLSFQDNLNFLFIYTLNNSSHCPEDVKVGSEWCCIQNAEDGVKITLGTENYLFSFFCMVNYFQYLKDAICILSNSAYWTAKNRNLKRGQRKLSYLDSLFSSSRSHSGLIPGSGIRHLLNSPGQPGKHKTKLKSRPTLYVILPSILPVQLVENCCEI